MKHSVSKSKLSFSNTAAYAILFALFLLLAYLLTLFGLLLLALLLYKIPLSNSAVNIGIVLIYIISNFTAAFLLGKKVKHKKFLWGFFLGCAYFLVLFLLSLIAAQSLTILGNTILTAFLLCSLSATFGGMLA